MSRPVFRFAPSPNGELHLGHAFSALLNQRMARAGAGRLLLRIEDIDTTRCTPEFEQAIYRDLSWLGIDWEQPVRRQSEHLATYQAVLERMIREELVYPAFMSRGDIRSHIAKHSSPASPWPRDPDDVAHYPGVEKAMSRKERQRRIDSGAPFAWRLDVAAACVRAGDLSWVEKASTEPGKSKTVAAHPQVWGDVVIARKEVTTSYHLSVVVDDALQEVSHVVRGRDLYPATSVHRLLQQLLGLPVPVYTHHRLIDGPDGKKLSKSRRDTGLDALRQAGTTRNDIVRMVGLD